MERSEIRGQRFPHFAAALNRKGATRRELYEDTVTEPKRHHYNAEMLTSRFADAEGNLHFFDKRAPSQSVMTSKPENVFVVGHLYSFIEKDGTKNTALEKFYSRVEGRANELIEKIVAAARAGRVPSLTQAEKAEWDVFVYHQWSRVPDLHLRSIAEFERYLREATEEFERQVRPLTDQERASLRQPETLKRLKQNARVNALGNANGPALDALGSRGLGVAIIEVPGNDFIIGSMPIVKLTYPGRTHLSDPTVEAWFPIASDIAVSPAGQSGTERLVPIRDATHVRALNQFAFSQSTVIAGRSRALISSVIGAKPEVPVA
jgi:hypothetical protein